MKPRVLFFARDYQADFFVFLKSDHYEPVLVTLTKYERKRIEKAGSQVAACFEEQFDQLPIAAIPENYLESSYLSDRYLRYTSVFEREKILGKEISFWQGIFEKQDPHLVVNETVALEISEVLYLEAKKKHIRYVSWMSFPLKNHFYFQSTPMHNSLSTSVFQRAPDELSLRKAEEYIAQVKGGAGQPFYVHNVKGRYTFYSLAKNVYWYLRCLLTEHHYRERAKNLAIFGDNSSFYFNGIKSIFNSLIFNYDKLERYEKYEKVFYPMHYEPEAVLFYMAEFYSNQLATIENIAKCLNHNQVLVVKEHPQQQGLLLQKKYRDFKKGVPNVVFLPAEISTFHLITQCSLVVTLGSTAGLEALILGKPVVVLGNLFYDKYENVNKVESFQELKALLRNQSDLKRPEHESLRNYLAKVISYSFSGNPFYHMDLYSSANIQNIVLAIEKELENELKNV